MFFALSARRVRNNTFQPVATKSMCTPSPPSPPRRATRGENISEKLLKSKNVDIFLLIWCKGYIPMAWLGLNLAKSSHQATLLHTLILWVRLLGTCHASTFHFSQMRHCHRYIQAPSHAWCFVLFLLFVVSCFFSAWLCLSLIRLICYVFRSFILKLICVCVYLSFFVVWCVVCFSSFSSA